MGVGGRGRQKTNINQGEPPPPNGEPTLPPAWAGLVDKAGYRHFMMKEIHEQPEVIGHTLTHYLDPTKLVTAIAEPKAVEALKAATRLTISACGTAFYAGQIGKYWFEKIARLAVEADVAHGPGQDRHVAAARHVVQDAALVGQGGGRHQLEHRVLGPGDADLAVERLAPGDDELLHRCRV